MAKTLAYTPESLERVRQGALRSNEIQRNKRLSAYLADPRRCSSCGETLPYAQRRNKFCSHSCSAILNNPKRASVRPCLHCGTLLRVNQRRYCSHDCQIEYARKLRVAEWLQGRREGGGPHGVYAFARNHLMHEQSGACAICGLSEWQGHPMPLICDHIDGNPTDHCRQNLRLVCGNCDMQLPTYKGKNKGNGRHYRRDRYKSGRSY